MKRGRRWPAFRSTTTACPTGLVALHCVDPAGLRREMLLWTLPQGDPLRLTLQPRGPADLPAGLVPIDWQIAPAAEALLEPVAATQLTGWEPVEAFLRTRWQGIRPPLPWTCVIR